MDTRTTVVGDDDDAVVDKTFAAFLRSPPGIAACGGTDLGARLTHTDAAKIISLSALLRWAKERHPDQYPPQDWRSPLPASTAPHGSMAMRAIWAKFLSWPEGGQSS